MKALYYINVLISILLLGSCTTSKKSLNKSKTVPELSKEAAEKRAKKIKNVKYKLYFDLSDKSEQYSGNTTIQFQLNNNSENLRIDFHQGNIKHIIANGKKITPVYNEVFVSINSEHLLLGNNTIEIRFTKNFSRDGAGLYRFVDSEDKRVYLYTDLQPYDANKVFPCFDQPNLKATYQMQILAPKKWEVITSNFPKTVKKNKNSNSWFFPESALFSTYIWSLHAGPYHVFNDKKAKYPSRIFVRKSMKKYVKIKDWQVFTRQGFEFLDNYFGLPYPYKKYDQLIVPDFNAGAMENVGAVTFSERFISRGIKTEAQRRSLANVIFHEMAHMWFGNLVTMDWWNDLWLNESFATYIANLGVSRNTEFKDKGWRDFNKTKQWAYWEDQLMTTHPIEANVPNTSQAFANFDGITYGKGAASLKQIHYFLGEKEFRNGLKLYFKNFANTNTKLKDFMSSLEEGSGRNLKNWQKMWLQNEGVNTISTNYSCSDGKIDKFEVFQTAPKDYFHIRPHSFKIALLNLKQNKYKVTKNFKVELNQPSKVITQVNGSECPDLIYPNYQDHDYMMVKLDTKTINNLKSGIHKVESSFLRQMFWSTLWDMVYYAQYDYKSYSELAQRQGIKKEKDPIILRNILNSVHGRYSTMPSVLFYTSHDRSLSNRERIELNYKLERIIWQRLKKAKAKSENQKILFRSFLSITNSKEGLNQLKELLNQKSKIRGLKIDQDKRWWIITKLNSYALEGAKELIQSELKTDLSSSGKKMKITANAIFPYFKNKESWIKEIKKLKSEYSYAELKSAIYNLFPRHQKQLRKKYSSKFFADMAWMANNKDASIAATFTSLAPNDCSKDTQKNLMNFLNQNHGLKPKVEKKLKIIFQENMRCEKVLNLATN